MAFIHFLYVALSVEVSSFLTLIWKLKQAMLMLHIPLVCLAKIIRAWLFHGKECRMLSTCKFVIHASCQGYQTSKNTGMLKKKKKAWLCISGKQFSQECFWGRSSMLAISSSYVSDGVPTGTNLCFAIVSKDNALVCLRCLFLDSCSSKSFNSSLLNGN